MSAARRDNIIKSVQCSLGQINFEVLSALMIIGFIPTIYKTVRIHFLGDMPTDWGFNIASQIAWINIIYEVLQEAIILPLFYLVGSSLSSKVELANKVKTGLMVTVGIYSCISIFIFLFAESLTIFMSQKDDLVDDTVTYIRLETIASIFYIAVQFLLLVLVAIKKGKCLYVFLMLQMMLSIFFDVFMVSKLPVSFDLGVNGIAISNIAVNVILLFAALFLLQKEGVEMRAQESLSFRWMGEWLKVGGYSGLESFVRNSVFLLMVLQMVNVVGGQGVFWVASSFIWGWLLLPIIQLGQLVKRDCGEFGDAAVKNYTLGYFAITAFVVLIWCLALPFMDLFIKNIMNVADHESVYRIVLVSIVFYVFFAFNNVIDSIFYGIGKTNYMLFQSVVVNFVFYGTLYVLYLNGIYKPTLDLIVVMFAVGVALDSFLTYAMFFWVLRKREIDIFNPLHR